MAIDSESKRRSVCNVVSGIYPPSNLPDSGTPKTWRQQAGWGFSGIVPQTLISNIIYGLLSVSWINKLYTYRKQ